MRYSSCTYFTKIIHLYTFRDNIRRGDAKEDSDDNLSQNAFRRAVPCKVCTSTVPYASCARQSSSSDAAKFVPHILHGTIWELVCNDIFLNNLPLIS